jgi:PTS system mannose-specific IIA component
MPDTRPVDRSPGDLQSADPQTVVGQPPRTPLVGVVVVTHGQLATELVNAAEMIVGELSGFVAVSIGWHDDVETAREAIAAAIRRVARPAGVIVLTDMFGGTPCNLAISLLQEDKIEVLAGLNLPMLVKLARIRKDSPLAVAVEKGQEAGRKYITIASRILGG